MFPGECPSIVPPHGGRGSSGGIFWRFVNFIIPVEYSEVTRDGQSEACMYRHLLLWLDVDDFEFVFKPQAGIKKSFFRTAQVNVDKPSNRSP